MVQLSGKRVAFLVADGFEQIEMTEPKRVLEHHQATTFVVSPNTTIVKGWKSSEWGGVFRVDMALAHANPTSFDALVIPGGVMSPDKLRVNTQAVEFVKAFFDEGKPVAAICHGPWLLAEADVVDGKTLTSYPSIRTDLENAGGFWVDTEVVVDQGLVTSRSPEDIPSFNQKILEEFHEILHHFHQVS